MTLACLPRAAIYTHLSCVILVQLASCETKQLAPTSMLSSTSTVHKGYEVNNQIHSVNCP